MTLFAGLVLSYGVAFAAGDKERGDSGNGTITQDLCGPEDDCAGDPYWWF